MASNIREMERFLHKSIGVLWLCAGNDWLDVLPIGDIDAWLCGILRRWTWLNSLDDHRRAFLAGPKTDSDGDCRTRELAGKLCRWHRISQPAGMKLLAFPQSIYYNNEYSILRPHSKTTHSCRSALCWEHSGYSPIKRCRRRRTRRLRRFWRSSDTEMRGKATDDVVFVRKRIWT